MERDNAPQLGVLAWLRVWKLWVRGKVCPPAQVIWKTWRSFPNSYTHRTYSDQAFPRPSVITSVYLLAAPLFGDVLTLPVQLRPPEMAIVVVIEAVCRYWEGAFVSGG